MTFLLTRCIISTYKRLTPLNKEIEKEVELPEDIHTFAGWKALGYSVKKGEKAVSKFPIWKYVKAKASEAEDANADGEASGHCIMKVAAFFSASQVQRS